MVMPLNSCLQGNDVCNSGLLRLVAAECSEHRKGGECSCADNRHQVPRLREVPKDVPDKSKTKEEHIWHTQPTAQITATQKDDIGNTVPQGLPRLQSLSHDVTVTQYGLTLIVHFARCTLSALYVVDSHLKTRSIWSLKAWRRGMGCNQVCSWRKHGPAGSSCSSWGKIPKGTVGV